VLSFARRDSQQRPSPIPDFYETLIEGMASRQPYGTTSRFLMRLTALKNDAGIRWLCGVHH
jgi:hypothetical protein